MSFFIDRDLGKKLGRALQAVGVQAVNHIDRYPLADAETVPDSRWIREAASRGDVVITRDSRVLRRRSAELHAITTANARGFVLETGNATPLDNLRALMIAWPKLQQIIASEPAPFMYGVDAQGRVKRRYP